MNFEVDANADENFFGALKRKNANLDQLFGIEKAQQSDQQQSLKYTPIKPETVENAANATNNAITSQPTETWHTLMAKVASAFKQGESVGKVGVALLRNNENTHKIVIYKTKVLLLATCTLHAETKQVHRQNRYLQFYDDTSCYWSIYFEMEAHEQEFWNKLTELNVTVSCEEITTPAEASNTEPVNQDTFLPIQHESGQVAKDDENEKIIDKPNKPPKGTHSKTELITRMAKMGQQLPKLSQATQSSMDCTDSSDTEVITTPAATQQKPTLLPRSNSKVLLKSQIVPVCSANMTAVINPTATVAIPTSNIEAQFMQMLLTENRTQNTELRMNMGKLENKMEKMLDKIDMIRSNVNDRSSKEDEILALEEKLLELKKENRRLKLDMEDLEEHTANKNYEIIRQRYRQELTEAELFNVENLERLVGDLLRKYANMHGKQEKFEHELGIVNEKLKAYETQLHDEQAKYTQAMAKVQQLELQIENLQEKLTNKEKQEAELRRKHAEDTVNEMQYLEEKINSLQERLDVKEKSEKVLRQQLAENIENQMQMKQQQDQQIEVIVKDIMNNLYANLALKLENIQPLQSNVAIAVVGKTIREATLKAIERVKQ